MLHESTAQAELKIRLSGEKNQRFRGRGAVRAAVGMHGADGPRSFDFVRDDPIGKLERADSTSEISRFLFLG
jgi:hypothetical protein